MFMLDLKSRVPIYEQLKNRMNQLIAAGILQQDSQLPSVRSLAKELGVNPNTIQKAYQDLERDGVIYSVAGRGSFVADVKEVVNSQVKNALASIEQACSILKSCNMSDEDILNQVKNILNKGEKV